MTLKGGKTLKAVLKRCGVSAAACVCIAGLSTVISQQAAAQQKAVAQQKKEQSQGEPDGRTRSADSQTEQSVTSPATTLQVTGVKSAAANPQVVFKLAQMPHIVPRSLDEMSAAGLPPPGDAMRDYLIRHQGLATAEALREADRALRAEHDKNTNSQTDESGEGSADGTIAQPSPQAEAGRVDASGK